MMESTRSPARSSRAWRWGRWAAGLTAAGYLLLMAALTAWLWLGADVHWAATLFGFAPRWLLTIPGGVVLVGALLLGHRLATAAAIGGLLLAAGPLAGGVLNIGHELPPDARLRVVTLNCDNKALDQARFRPWLQALEPDILLLQDSRVELTDLPPGWHLALGAGGRCVASRFPIERLGEIADPVGGEVRGAMRVKLETNLGELIVVNVHLPTPRDALEAALGRSPDIIPRIQQDLIHRSTASAAVRRWVGEPGVGATLVGGDFNMVPESTLLRRDWSAWDDAFRVAGTGWGWTMFSRWSRVRIDRLLVTAPWRCRAAWVGPDLGSAHRPVIADLDLGGV